jgi:hypothetical protein
MSTDIPQQGSGGEKTLVSAGNEAGGLSPQAGVDLEPRGTAHDPERAIPEESTKVQERAIGGESAIKQERLSLKCRNCGLIERMHDMGGVFYAYACDGYEAEDD